MTSTRYTKETRRGMDEGKIIREINRTRRLSALLACGTPPTQSICQSQTNHTISISISILITNANILSFCPPTVSKQCRQSAMRRKKRRITCGERWVHSTGNRHAVPSFLYQRRPFVSLHTPRRARSTSSALNSSTTTAKHVILISSNFPPKAWVHL